MGSEGSEAPDSTDEAGEGEPVPTQQREAGVREIEPLGGNMTGAQEPEGMSTKVQRIAELARAYPARAFVSLAHVMDRAWLYEAYRRTRKDGAVGIDGQTAAMYEADLDANLKDLLERLKSGRYRAPAVRRVQIPKADGRKRPIGIPTLEDKVAQRAVVMVLETLYEPDFLDCSYGFRPGRSPHQALDALRNHLKAMGGGWVVEIDIRSFFDELDKGALRGMLDERVRDGVIRKLIDKWLTAGVVENGQVIRPEKGTPQGGKHLPTRRAGPVVRPGGQTASSGTRRADSVRRRCGDGVCQRTGCPSGNGRAAEAHGAVRSSVTSGKDEAAIVSSSAVTD